MSINPYASVLPTGDDVYTIFDMTNEEKLEIERKMRLNANTKEGYLNETESLEETCKKDLDSLLRINTTCEQVSQILRGIIKRALEIVPDRSNIYTNFVQGKKLEIFGLSSISLTNINLLCPFNRSQNHPNRSPCHKETQFYTVKNLTTDQSFTFHYLAIGLIGKHAFFGGSTKYRVDPEKIFQVLELRPGQFQTKVEKIWRLCWTNEDMEESESAEKLARDNAEKIVEIDECATAYLDLPYINSNKFTYRDKTKIQKIKEQNKDSSSDELADIIKFHRSLSEKYGKEWNPNRPVFISDGKKYLHIINNRNRFEDDEMVGVKLTIEDRFVEKPRGETITVYTPVDNTYAVVDL